MTGQEILAMTGDKQEEVDLVATEVMGWYKGWSIAHPFQWYAKKNFENGRRKASGNWNPFESWNDVGMVWKRLRELNFVLKISDPFDHQGKERVICEAFRDANQTTAYAEADNVLTAICRAALLAVCGEQSRTVMEK